MRIARFSTCGIAARAVATYTKHRDDGVADDPSHGFVGSGRP
jgi:hypothetical protein